MTKRTRTVLLAIAGLVLVSAVAVVGLGVWFFTSAIESVAADDVQAAQSFAEVRGRFEGLDPILTMTDGGPVFAQPPPAAPERDLEHPAYRLGSGRAAPRHHHNPFWLARMKEGPFSVSASTFVPNVKVSITARELERYGPALLIDHADEDGSRVLIWTE